MLMLKKHTHAQSTATNPSRFTPGDHESSLFQLVVQRKLAPWKGSMDSLPEEVIGTILSHIGSARSVVMASATSRKWLRAAKDHLHTLTFDESDFAAMSGHLTSSVCEHIITQTVLTTSSLNRLSVWVKPSSASFELQASSVMKWLQHTEKTLRSLTVLNSIKLTANFFKVLDGGQSILEHLEWGSAWIPSIDPSFHRLESLVSFVLSSTETGLTVSSLEALFLVCPNLESLSLIDIHMWGDEDTVNLKSHSLKALFIGGLYGIDSIALHMDRLERLQLKGVKFMQVKLVQGKEHGELKQLLIECASIKELEIGRSADSLQEVHINALDMQDEWARYYQIVSRASNLRKLCVCSDVPSRNMSIVDLSQIASTFPHLRSLALTYHHAPKAFKDGRGAGLLIFRSVTILELSTHRFHVGFARWIGEFLKRCPNLKQLKISGKAYWGADESRIQEMADYTSLIIPVLGPYPHIDIKICYL